MRTGFVTVFFLQLLGLILVGHAQNTLEETFYDFFGGSIQSPSFPGGISPFTFCNWRFYAETRKKVQLDFTALDFEEVYNHVVVFDGPDCMAPRIAVGSKLPFKPPASWSNQLSVLLLNDGDCLGTGVSAKYTALKRGEPDSFSTVPSMMSNCGGSLYSPSGSLRVSQPTEGPTLCVWRIATDPNKVINLKINNLQRGDWSWVRVLDGGDCSAPTLKLFGRSEPGNVTGPVTLTSTDNAMMVLVLNAEPPFVQMEAEYTAGAARSSDLFKRGISRSTRGFGRPTLIAATCPDTVVLNPPP